MLKVRYSTQFKKDFKLAKKRGLPLQESNRSAQRFIGIIDFPAQKSPETSWPFTWRGEKLDCLRENRQDVILNDVKQ